MKIAIVKLSALGDIIHAMIVLQFIKRELPNAKIDWIVDENFKQILENNPNINKIHSVSLQYAKQQKSLKLLLQELQKVRKFGKYDIVIDMQGLLKSGIIAKLISSKITVGFDKNSIREKIASYFYNKKIKIDYNENIVLRNAFLISQALNINISNIDIDNKKPFLFSANYQFDCLVANKKNIAIIIGASSPSKIYSVEKYAEVISQIHQNFIIIWGNEQEQKMAKDIQKICPQIQIANKLSLNELKSLIKQVDLVIGGDTGPVHMAWGLAKKSITIFGVTPSKRNALETNINKIISSKQQNNLPRIDMNIGSIASYEIIKIIKTYEF